MQFYQTYKRVSAIMGIRAHLTTLLLLIGFLTFSQNDKIPIDGKEDNLKDPFKNLMYDKVVAFNFNYDSINKKKTFKQVEQNPAELKYNSINKCSIKNVNTYITKQLISIVMDTATYGENYGDCFTPRLGFTFFNKGKEVFSIFICFDCGFLESTTSIPAARKRFYDNDYFGNNSKGEMDETKPRKYRRYLKGFSSKGQNNLADLCEKLSMTYCTEYRK